MLNYPVSRCQHIKINGTQCGSPALRNHRRCFFHSQFRTSRIRINSDAPKRPASITMPVFEDANSIQVAIMQVTRLLIAGQIDHKTASLTLYALQIASCNLARVRIEGERPSFTVVDCAKVAETPIRRTPWSELSKTGAGHDSEYRDAFEDEIRAADPSNFMERLLGLEPITCDKEELEQEEAEAHAEAQALADEKAQRDSQALEYIGQDFCREEDDHCLPPGFGPDWLPWNLISQAAKRP